MGVTIEALRVTAEGYLLDMRYRVVDRERAKRFLDPKQRLFIIKDGQRLGVPSPPKIGRLRQMPKDVRPDKVYFILFANPRRLVEPGDLVSLEVGKVMIKDIPVH